MSAESDDGGRFIVYNRWGRVGVRGQDKLFGPYTCQDTAIYEFEQKFYAKTKNYWSNRKEFKCYPNCYTWLEMDYSEMEKEPVVGLLTVHLLQVLVIFLFMNLIFDLKVSETRKTFQFLSVQNKILRSWNHFCCFQSALMQREGSMNLLGGWVVGMPCNN